MVRYTDHLVGRLVEAIDRLRLGNDTILIFTTDNGTAGSMLGTIDGAKPSGGKATMYEGGICQPFIVRGPGRVPEGKVTDALVDFSDLFPTLADLAGAQLPQQTVIDGRSFAPLLLGEADDSPRRWILSMGHGKAVRDADGVRGRHAYTERVLRDKRFKIWVGPDRRVRAFYDLQTDPAESHNLLPSIPAEGLPSWLMLHQAVDRLPPLDARLMTEAP